MPNLDLTISEIMKGDIPVLKIMKGNTKVWPSGDIAIISISTENAICSENTQRVALHSSFYTTITTISPYTLNVVEVIMDGNDITSSAFNNDNEISIQDVVGDVIINVKAELQYVSSGLTYHFDGINKGTDNTRWTDLVSGAYFTLNSHSRVGNDSIIMDGAGYLTGSSTMFINASNGTIEACVERTSGTGSAIVFLCSGNTGLSVIISGSGMCYRASSAGQNNQYVLTRADKFIWSSTNQMCIYNGTKYTSLSGNNWNNGASVATLGARNAGTAYYFAGKIHSIRIYNRKLTEDEISHNQSVDNIRFNMGLNI